LASSLTIPLVSSRLKDFAPALHLYLFLEHTGKNITMFLMCVIEFRAKLNGMMIHHG
jgi:hypothetical protein